MAVNYSNYPQYGAAVSKVQKLEMRLNGASGSRATGLAQAMDNLAASKGQDSAEYKNVKAEFDKVQVELAAAKAEATAIRAEIDKIADEKDKASNAKKQAEKDSANVNQLILERDQAKRRNDDATAKAKQQQIDAIKRPVDANKSKQASGNQGIDWSAYAIDSNGVNKAGKQVVFVSETDANGNVQPKEYGSLSDARVAFLKSYSSPEALKSLQNELVNKHYIKSSQINDGTWVSGLDTLIQKYSIKVVSDALYNPSAKPINTSQFLASTSSLSGSGTPTQFKTITTRGDAKKELDYYLSDLLNRKSTPEEEEAYYTQLHAAESKAIRTSSNGTTTGSNLSDTDHLTMAAFVARKSLQGTDAEKLLTSGGRVATDIATLQKFAASYGVTMPASEALKYVAAGIGKQDYLAKQEERIRQTAIALHPQLKDHFLAGGTYKDIADQYKYAKQNKLGITVKDSNLDKDIADAIAKGMSINDFNRSLQSHPDWAKTPEAHSIAADFVSNIAQTWGLG